MTGDNKKILIVEDQKFIRNIVALNLRKTGFEIVQAENGKEGYELAKTEKPNLILLDLMMPVMNGFETLKLLKADDLTRKIPVIILSALSQKNQVLDAISLGALDYITKPFKIEIANQKIIQVLKKMQSVQKQINLETYPSFYKNNVLYVKCPDEFIDIEYIKKLLNTISKNKEEICEVLIDLTENAYIDNLNVIFFDRFFEKLKTMSIKISVILKNDEMEENFKTSDIKTEYKIFKNISDALPIDIELEEISNLTTISAETAKYSGPVSFKNHIPILNYYIEPAMNQVDDLEAAFNELLDYNKHRIIVNLHNIHSVPARFAGNLIKFQSIVSSKFNGKIELVIQSEQLIIQLKEGGFLSKFEVYTDEEAALERINF
ncbi:MAG TPA: response regulator [bacterium]|nr:response regulator [bacterium]HPN29900.1 response regulator [bacterium]